MTHKKNVMMKKTGVAAAEAAALFAGRLERGSR
jgi:hypothetical protein